MKNEQQWSVHVERQPHRDAVRRLRKAYKRLWEMQQPTSDTTATNQKSDQAHKFVQEVKK